MKFTIKTNYVQKLNVLIFSIILNLIFSLKITERIPIGYQRYVQESSNLDKIIMPPPFLPNPDFANEVENTKSLEKINENFNSFRFKNMPQQIREETIQPNTKNQMNSEKSDTNKQEEYVLIPTPVDYEQFMKMQYSKDFTNINSFDNNIIPDGLQNKLSAGLIDKNIFNNYNNQNLGLDVLSIANSTALQTMNKDIYNQINNGVEQKFLIEYANKLSHESKIDSPKYPIQYYAPNPSIHENKEKTMNKAFEFDNSKANSGAPFNMNFLEKKGTESPIKNLKDLTSDPQKFMKMQEDQYQKYFDEINKMEYKKIYDSLNDKNYEKQIYDKILNSDSNIDYSEIWKNNQKPIIMPSSQGFPGYMNETFSIKNYTGEEMFMLQTSSMPVPDNANKENLNFQNMNFISLPENKQQMEELYKNFFKNININNTLNGVSLLQESTANSIENKAEKEMNQYDKIVIPTKGLVNTKVQPINHPIIGFDLNNTLENAQNNVEEDIVTKKIIEQKEINKRLYEKYPIYRETRPYEKEDLEEKKIRDEKKKIEFQNHKAKLSKGFSFMQKRNNDDLESLTNDKNSNSLGNLESMVKSNLSRNGNKMNVLLKDVQNKIKNKRLKVKENLLNCKNSCKETCNRVISLGKNESFELCKTKCELACSNNALNSFLK